MPQPFMLQSLVEVLNLPTVIHPYLRVEQTHSNPPSEI